MTLFLTTTKEHDRKAQPIWAKAKRLAGKPALDYTVLPLETLSNLLPTRLAEVMADLTSYQQDQSVHGVAFSVRDRPVNVLFFNGDPPVAR